MKLTRNQLLYNASRNSFTAEISQLRIGIPPQRIQVDDLCFVFSKTDLDGSGEDIMGWHYREVHATKKTSDLASLLIIND